MADPYALPLRLVDGLDLGAELRQALRPGERVRDAEGRLRRLPRFFYEIDSWQTAKETRLAPRFALREFINTDVYEADVLRRYPRYVPCAVAVLAAHLAVFRAEVDTYVHVAANGGYRSPAHARTRPASTHCWGSAVNIYRIGGDYLDSQETIERYAETARQVLPHAWVRPFGYAEGFADDHLHIDLGYLTVAPRTSSGEAEPPPVAPDAGAPSTDGGRD